MCSLLILAARAWSSKLSLFTEVYFHSRATAKPKLLLAFGCGPLSLAALEGNLEKMKQLLTNHPNTVNDVSFLNQTPLHLAVGQPACVELLLKGPGRKLLDLPDRQGSRPVQYALFSCHSSADERQYHSGCLRNRGDNTLAILLDQDCMVPTIFPTRIHTSISPHSTPLCDNCLRTVLHHLVDRRERLKMLAIENLPRMQATSLGLFSPSVLDSYAPRVIQSLDELGIPGLVPTALQVDGSYKGRTSIYHNKGFLPFPTF